MDWTLKDADRTVVGCFDCGMGLRAGEACILHYFDGQFDYYCDMCWKNERRQTSGSVSGFQEAVLQVLRARGSYLKDQ